MYRHFLASGLIALLIISFSIPSFAASVSGFVKQPSNRPAVGVVVSFNCPGGVQFAATTDQYGRYRLRGLPDVTWCNLSLKYKDEDSAPVKINSGSGSREININLKNSESGLTITM